MVNKTKLKPLSPLQAMTQHSQNDLLPSEIPKDSFLQNLSPNNIHNSENLVILVEPSQICNWKYHDRPLTELGDIDEFAAELKNNGQLQPCIVRPLSNNNEYKFELIVGERRWRAAKKANIQLKVLIKELNDHDAAIAQANENSQRKDSSEFAKGMSYAKLINDKVLSQADLTETLKVSQAEVSRLLSFSKIPQIVWDAIEDKSKISARTAAEIRSLCNKGDRYIEAIVKLAKEIERGKLGEKLLKRELNNFYLTVKLI